MTTVEITGEELALHTQDMIRRCKDVLNGLVDAQPDSIHHWTRELRIHELALRGLEAEEGGFVARSEFDAEQWAHGQAVAELADLRAQVLALREVVEAYHTMLTTDKPQVWRYQNDSEASKVWRMRRDAPASATAIRERIVDEEATRWAKRFEWLHRDYGADCSGVDSGDPLDCVESEVRQVINGLREDLDAARMVSQIRKEG